MFLRRWILITAILRRLYKLLYEDDMFKVCVVASQLAQLKLPLPQGKTCPLAGVFTYVTIMATSSLKSCLGSIV